MNVMRLCGHSMILPSTQQFLPKTTLSGNPPKKTFEFQICIPHTDRNVFLAIQSKGNYNWLYRKFKEGKIVSHKSIKHIICFLSVYFNKHILLRILYLNYTTTLSIQKSFNRTLQSISIMLCVLMMYTI